MPSHRLRAEITDHSGTRRLNSLYRSEKDSEPHSAPWRKGCKGTGMFSGLARGEKVFCKMWCWHNNTQQGTTISNSRLAGLWKFTVFWIDLKWEQQEQSMYWITDWGSLHEGLTQHKHPMWDRTGKSRQSLPVLQPCECPSWGVSQGRQQTRKGNQVKSFQQEIRCTFSQSPTATSSPFEEAGSLIQA